MQTNWKPQAKPPNPSPPISKHKVIFLGDQSTGKSSLINRSAFNTFDPSQQPTVGIDFVSQNFHIKNQTVRLQLWDTAGQSRFASLIPSYIKGSSAIILMYDVTNQTSFKNIRIWLQWSKDHAKQDVLVYLVGNKIDLGNRVVRQEQGEQFARDHGIAFIEVSAKTGQNIQELFNSVAHILSKTPIETSQNPSQSHPQQPNVSLQNPRPVSTLSCCS